MASREKRPLAPSKTKQKANESSSSSPTSNNNNNSSIENNALNISGTAKKTKQSVANNTSIQQLSKDIVEPTVTENQLSPKIESTTPPRRRVIQSALKRSAAHNTKLQQLSKDIIEQTVTENQLSLKIDLPPRRVIQSALKRKQKAKKTLIKVKPKVPIKALKRLQDTKKKILGRKPKGVVKTQIKSEPVENNLDQSEGTKKTKPKAAKKTKGSPKATEDSEISSDKVTPKLGRKSLSDTLPKTGRGRGLGQKKTEGKTKKILNKDTEEIKIKQEPIDTSYETTIEEVIASSMLIDDISTNTEEVDEEFNEKKLVKNPFCGKRGLRSNGKLKQTVCKGETAESEKKLEVMSENSIDNQPLQQQQQEQHTQEEQIEVDQEKIVNNEQKEKSAPEGLKIIDIRQINDVSKKIVVESLSNSSSLIMLSNNLSVPSTSNNCLAIPSTSKGIVQTPTNGTKSVVRRNSKSGTGSPLNSSQINDIISQIKTSIAKTIEDKVYQEKSYILGGKAFELPKKEEGDSTEEDKNKSRGYYRVVGSIKKPISLTIQEPIGSANTEPPTPPPAAPPPSAINKSSSTTAATSGNNSDEPEADVTPKVADTAKEIEKLVMGESDNDNSASITAPSAPQTSAQEQNFNDNVDTTKDNEADVTKTSDKIEEAGTDTNMKQLEEIKKSTPQTEEMKKSAPPCPIRRSARVTAGFSSNSSEARRSRSLSDSTSCHNSSSEDDKSLVKEVSTEVKSTVMEIDQVHTNVEVSKPKNPESIVIPEKTELMEIALSKTEEIVPKIEDITVNKYDEEMVKDDIVKKDEEEIIEKLEEKVFNKVDEKVLTKEETLESLSDEVQKLVEQDNSEKPKLLDSNNDTDGLSDAEMRLVIDETPTDISQTLMEQSNKLESNKDNCDENIETSNGDKTKVKVKTEEVEEKKRGRRPIKNKGEKKRPESRTKSTSSSKEDKSEAKTKLEETVIAAKCEEVPLTVQDNVDISNVTAGESSQATESINEPSEANEMVASATIKIELEDPAAETVAATTTQKQPQIRTRRGKGQQPVIHQSLIFKRKRGPRKGQNSKKVEVDAKEETTALDNEVAEINENNLSPSSYEKNEKENLRGFSANAASDQVNNKPVDSSNRSKSENDVCPDNLSTNNILKNENEATVTERKPSETVENSDESSTSGESSSSVIFETPEDRAKKENILRLLGLESREKAKERRVLEEKKREQSSGTLKTVIRLKDKDGKRRSRSPIKMVLKQQGKTEGEEPTDIYTIQKECGSSGLGDSSSGANRKLSTNPRHSCDEEIEDPATKGRQSLVIPEKSSSFSIHPGRLCRDNCCYCHGKFGSLDTPMHLAQMKSDERRNKILENESHLTKDSCLCDACYRHVDRKANMSPTNMLAKPIRHNRQSIMGCIVRNCKEPSRHHIKRRWLLKIKDKLRKAVDVNWESPVQNLMTFCGTHYSVLERFLICTLCLRRLSRQNTLPLGMDQPACDDLNKQFRENGIPADIIHNTFICRLCKYYIKVFQKFNDNENLNESTKNFFKNYTKKLKYGRNVDVSESEEEQDDPQNSSKNKDKSRPASRNNGKKTQKLPNSKSDNESPSASASDKSTPEPPKTDKEPTNSRCMGIEGAIEKLKKRKAIDTSTTSSNGSARDMVEILTMDKDVTLTRIAKKPKLANNNSNINNNNKSNSNGNITNDIFQRLENNRSISVRVLFPGEEDINLQGNIDFNNVREVTPQGWEKCATVIQYDRDTKSLWNELQRPYGSQSSFLRHLIILEKYYRTGDLILAPNASRNAINYSTSVQNRLISYEGPERMDDMSGRITPELSKLPPLSSGGCMVEQSPIYNSQSVNAPSVSIAPVSAIRTSTTTSNVVPVSAAFGSAASASAAMRNSGASTSMTSTSTAIKSTPTSTYANVTAQLSKLDGSQQIMKLTPGVSIIKKPPPSLQRLNPPNGASSANGDTKKLNKPKQNSTQGGKVFQLTEPELKRLQTLKKQKMMNERQSTTNSHNSSGSSNTSTNYKTAAALSDYQSKIAQSQFQKHLRMQQEMLSQRRRGDFEPIICDMRASVNENTPTQNLILNNLNLPKSIQVTTKTVAPVATSTPISILPKIPKNLTIIPQTVTRGQEK